MIKIGIAVFAYNRSKHISRVFSGLKDNEGVSEVYVFQDGLKCEADRIEWEKTKKVIENVKWCNIKKYESQENKGLANSIVDGVNVVLKEKDAIIVLEDDCIPQPLFVTFMRQCFEKYRNNEQITMISGYAWPMELRQNNFDAYFCGRMCSWGWGTWKDRWKKYERDYGIILRVKSNKEASKRLADWGMDLEDMLISNIRGLTDSWAVFFALYLIEDNGLAINPYKTLIKNCGFDGSGVHCGNNERFQPLQIDKRKKGDFNLPDNIDVDREIIKNFRKLYGTYTYVNQKSKYHVLIYGISQFYQNNELEICKKYHILAFIDKYRKDKFYAGIDIIHPKQIADVKYDSIIIMLTNRTACNEVISELVEVYGVERHYIHIGLDIIDGIKGE